MKKGFCIILALTLVSCLFFGCQTPETPDNTSGNVTTTPNQFGETAPTDNTMATEPTQATTQPQTEPTEGITAPTEPKPTEPKPTEPKPTEPKPTEPTQPKEEKKVIAGGEWDGGPVTWKITEDGVLTFSGPTHIQAKNTYIWKDYSNMITTIVFEEGITKIPENAFSGMTMVTTVHFGSTVSEIGMRAFEGCTALESVTIAKSTQKIGKYAFYKCSGLKSVSFAPGCALEQIDQMVFAETGILEFVSPPGLRTIQATAFKDCKSLETVRLEGGIERAVAGVFTGCTRLTYVVLGESLKDATSTLFTNCDAITTVVYKTSASISFTNKPQLTTVTFDGDEICNGCLEKCTALTDVTIGPNVTVIGNNAFRESGLKKITIPDNVRKIGSFAFRDSQIQEIYFSGNAPTIDSRAFLNVTATIYYPAGDSSWLAWKNNNYGGNLTWIAQ